VFNRDIIFNKSEVIEDCQKSKGFISDKTIISNHPWIEDIEEELKQIEKERKTDEPPMFGEGSGEGSGDE